MNVDHTALREVIRTIFAAAGSMGAEPDLIADNLVDSNLAGRDFHGIGMLPGYIASALAGRLEPNRHATVISDNGAILVVDGESGYGVVVAREAMALGIERVKETGVCVVALRNAYHIGRTGAWAEQCSAADCASVHFVNVIDEPYVAPFGGTDALISTNPFSAGLPATSGAPVFLDMAISKIAAGKAVVAMNKGLPLADGLLIDANGQPSNDPKVLFADPRGALLPMGEHKG